jgi:hypothetical protein
MIYTCRAGLSKLRIAGPIVGLVLHHVPVCEQGVHGHRERLDEQREALERWEAHLARLKAVDPHPA